VKVAQGVIRRVALHKHICSFFRFFYSIAHVLEIDVRLRATDVMLSRRDMGHPLWCYDLVTHFIYKLSLYILDARLLAGHQRYAAEGHLIIVLKFLPDVSLPAHYVIAQNLLLEVSLQRYFPTHRALEHVLNGTFLPGMHFFRGLRVFRMDHASLTATGEGVN
jgi:hypothetical protein